MVCIHSLNKIVKNINHISQTLKLNLTINFNKKICHIDAFLLNYPELIDIPSKFIYIPDLTNISGGDP